MICIDKYYLTKIDHEGRQPNRYSLSRMDTSKYSICHTNDGWISWDEATDVGHEYN
jgi:hypothetical protein